MAGALVKVRRSKMKRSMMFAMALTALLSFSVAGAARAEVPRPPRFTPAAPSPPPPAPAALYRGPVASQYAAPARVASVQSDGQWVYTVQYGWIWMAYDQAYTYVSPNAAVAYAFVYDRGVGWRWVTAPWVLGVGPTPNWGVRGPGRFAWHARPYFRPVPARAVAVRHQSAPARAPRAASVRHGSWR
jgi:hypothetical protein